MEVRMGSKETQAKFRASPPGSICEGQVHKRWMGKVDRRISNSFGWHPKEANVHLPRKAEGEVERMENDGRMEMDLEVAKTLSCQKGFRHVRAFAPFNTEERWSFVESTHCERKRTTMTIRFGV